eukprot:3550271-Alexandrium_andersonii.AAC.1
MLLRRRSWDSVIPSQRLVGIHDFASRQGLACVHVADLSSVCFPRVRNPGTLSPVIHCQAFPKARRRITTVRPPREIRTCSSQS